jgi:AraC family transcriptional regulator
MHDLVTGSFATTLPTVTISPSNITRRRTATWGGVTVDSVELIRQERIDCTFQGPRHLLIVSEHAERYDGEMLLDGVLAPQRNNLGQRLTLIPAGRQLSGWKKPRSPMRATHFYIDPHGPLLDPELRFSEIEFKPQLFFFDRELWAIAQKLKAQVDNPSFSHRSYAEALSIVLAHELIRVNTEAAVNVATLRGGLAGWQQRRVADYIEEHVTEDVSLAQLALLVELSPYHFGRAFKQSFGLPPLRYHARRRMEYAKLLLAKPTLSITQIGREIGFSETSAFTAAFRKYAGTTPTDFRRAGP